MFSIFEMLYYSIMLNKDASNAICMNNVHSKNIPSDS